MVAQEVRNLANRSSLATREIEAIVQSIQLETEEVVKAMEMGPIEDLNGMSMMANESMR